MGTECSTNEPLLSSSKEKDNGFGYVKKTPFLVKSSKLFLKFAIWLVFLAWATFLFLLPLSSVDELHESYVQATSGTVFGITGNNFLVFGGPLLIIVFLGLIYLRISEEKEFQEKERPVSASFRLRTFPVIVDGPIGVVTAAELIGILLFSVFIIWAVSVYTIRNYNLVPFLLSEGKRHVMLKHTGMRLGFIGLICLVFLFLPVARGSVLLQLINIPFEHATRYHIWLGHLTMLLFTLHGLCYVIAWIMDDILVKKLTDWKIDGIANLPGVISLLAGLSMWVTSLPPVRRRNFEIFYYTHQLYVVFVVFLAMHVGDLLFGIVAAGIFLFMLDRFLRFFQSQRAVDILSANCLPSGILELVISKPENLQYNALSWVFLQVRELSWLQWHPFSVSSSPLDGKHHLTILIKVLGDWTKKLRGHIVSVSEEQAETDRLLQPNVKLKAYVEGPYGPESPCHLMYENLILVAGGIGISPFLAVLSDILHRIRESKPCLPRNILIIWAVRESDELQLLPSLDIESLCPYTYNTLNLEIQTYVTRESEPAVENGKVQKHVSSSLFAAHTQCGMSSLVGTGNITWFGIYVVVSTIGLVVSMALLNVFYVSQYGISYRWYKGLLLMLCMGTSVILFGGSVIGLWYLWDRKMSAEENSKDEKKIGHLLHTESKLSQNLSHEVNTITYGRRPDFKDIFGTMVDRWGNVDIGVMVCGPTALQTSIAKECRSRNFERKSNDPVFHFNSHNFVL